MEDVIKHQNVNHYKSFVIKGGGQWSKKCDLNDFLKAIFIHNSCICFILIPCSHPINISCPLTSYLNLLGNLLHQQPVGGPQQTTAKYTTHMSEYKISIISVYRGQYLSKVIQGRSGGEPATGSWAAKVHWCMWGAKVLLHGSNYCSYCRKI